jgi:hypothetical protein
MPWPHNNDLGKEVPPASFQYIFNAQINKTMEEKPNSFMKGKVTGQFPKKPVWNDFPLKDPIKDPILENLKKAYGDNQTKPEPILIPATQSHPYTNPFSSMSGAPPSSLPNMGIMQMRMGCHGLGLNKPIFNFNHVIEPYHNYTESDVRAMLFKAFQAFTENIIVQLKGKTND